MINDYICPMEQRKRTEIAELGEFGLIERLAGAVGEDAAQTDCNLASTDLLLEGVDFDLTYFPLKHLGYKAVTVAVSDILAMNGTPRQLLLGVGVSARSSVEDLEELYDGVRTACGELGVELAGGDTSASVNGLVLSVTALGTADNIVRRSGARQNDLICLTGDLGAAYMGLHLLEREKRAFAGHDAPQPDFTGREYLLERWLRPRARLDVITLLRDAGIVPTSMIDLSDGLGSDLLQVCRSSSCGARIYLDRLPIARETHAMAEELHADPVVAALNGGGDYELLFTVPLEMRDAIVGIGGIEIIGHITPTETGVALTTPDGSDIPITAPGFR